MHCKRKEKHKIKNISGFFTPATAANKSSILQIKALKSDGENPANHTNKISAIMRMMNVSFLRPKRLPKKSAMELNIERCIPESAIMCERPAVLKDE